MNREQLIRNTKKEMKRWIETIDEQNFREIESKVTHYFNFLETVSLLPEPAPVASRPAKKESVEPKIIFKAESKALTENIKEAPSERRVRVAEAMRDSYIESAKEYYELYSSDEIEEQQENDQQIELDLEPEQTGHVFTRKLRGGVLESIDAFVPEGIVRKLGIEHGDLLKAEIINEYAGRKKYKYEVLESRSAGDAPDRKQMNHCLIEKEAGCFVVKRSETTKEIIRFNEVPFSAVLSDGDVQYFEVKEGDVVDIAYRESNPADNRILWVHDNQLPEEARKTWNEKKPAPTSNEAEQIEQTLVGADVMVVGNEGSRIQYQIQVEKRGGNFIWLDPHIQQERFAPLVRKASFVIFLNGKNGHGQMKKIKQLCKNYNKPFEATFNDGVSSVVRTAEDLAAKYCEGNKKESV